MRLRSPASLPERSGEGAGRPGLARCCCRVTVSTKPDLGRPSDPPVKSRSGRDGTAPRSRFPRALRLAALASGLTGSPPLTLLPATREGLGAASSPLHWRAASRRRPSIDLRKDPRSIHPPGFIARPQPADIGALDPTPSPPTGWAGVWHGSRRGWFVTLFILKGERSQAVGGAGYAGNRRMGSASNSFSP